MKNFKKLNMVLFDSSNALFKVEVQAQMTRKNQMGIDTPLVYITEQGNANLNPNIYLVFTYKSDQYDANNSLFMSYPQLYRLRETMKTVRDAVTNEDAFIRQDGLLSVKPTYAEPYVINGIGKQNKWLAFKIVVAHENDVDIPAVVIQISSVANGEVSTLSAEEFLAVYSIVNDLNLATLQAEFSFAYLSAEQLPPANPGYGATQSYNNYYQPQPPRPTYSQSQYQQPYQHQVYQNRAPQYNNQPRRQFAQTNSAYTQQAAQPPITQQPKAPQQNLPPRADKPVMNLDAVEQTPVMGINYDDSAAVDAIFNED